MSSRDRRQKIEAKRGGFLPENLYLHALARWLLAWLADCWTRRLVLLFFLALTDISLRAIFCRRFVKGARK
jgi:hypothetical protein